MATLLSLRYCSRNRPLSSHIITSSGPFSTTARTGSITSTRRLLSTEDASSSSQYVDPALEWGRTHSQLAQACLEVPPLPAMEDGGTFSNFASFRDYWKWRQWKFPVSNDNDLQYGQALVSHTLSAPLTLASFLIQVLQNRSHQPTNPIRICCVGARAEATLPLEFWTELLVAMVPYYDYHSQPPPLHIQLDFVGPDIHPKMPSQKLNYEQSRLDLNWLYKGYLHDYINNPNNAQKWDAFVLFNPGLGHPHLKEGWDPTLCYLLECHKNNKSPLLLTFHSEVDAQRDWDLLTTDHSLCIAVEPPTPNPFASRITYADPFDSSHHLVQPNHSQLVLI